MSYFTKRYIEVLTDKNTIALGALPGRLGRRFLPLAGARAELDDPGAVKRGFTLTTGFVGRNRDKGSVFVTVTNGQQTEAIEIPRRYGLEARQAVAQINSRNGQE